MIWFTSDTHLGHANAIEFTNRPFSDIEAMNRTLIANINAFVQARDELCILGDFGFRIPAEDAAMVKSHNHGISKEVIVHGRLRPDKGTKRHRRICGKG